MWKKSLGLILAVCATIALASEKKLLVVAEEFAPFEFVQNGKVVGIDIDIAKHIFKKLGIEAEFKILPWKRAWKMAEDGSADLILTTSRKDKRKEFLYYPKENMWSSEFLFFVNTKKKKENFKSYEDAKGLKVGVILGNSYHDSFWDAKLKTEEAVNIEINLKKLAAGRIDLFIIDKTVGMYTAKLLGLQNKIEPYNDFIAFSKGYPAPFIKNSKYPNIEEISKKFESELINMKKSGEYKKIIDKWLK